MLTQNDWNHRLWKNNTIFWIELSMNNWGNVILLCALTASLLCYALRNPSEGSVKSYSVANRNVGVFALTATLVMTEFNTATLISFSSLGYLSGLKALILPGVFLIGLLFYALTVAKKWKAYNGVSVVDYFINRFDKKIGAISAIFLLTAMAGFGATYLKSLTFLCANLFPQTSYWVVSAYIVLLTLFMVIRKGLVSIIKVDAFSFVLVLLAMLLILYKISGDGFLQDLERGHTVFKTEILRNEFIFSLIPLTMFSYILAPWYGQRIFAAKNARVAYVSVILSALFVFFLYALGVLISYSVALKGVKLEDPQLSFPYAVDASLTKFIYLGYALLFLISSTSLTGVWNAMANITLEFAPFNGLKNKNILMTLLWAFVTYILSNALIDNILNKMILANIPVVALSFALLAGFYWPRVSITGVYVSIIIGMASGISSYLFFGEEGCYTYYWAFIGIPLTFMSGIVASILFPRKILSSYSSKEVHASSL